MGASTRSAASSRALSMMVWVWGSVIGERPVEELRFYQGAAPSPIAFMGRPTPGDGYPHPSAYLLSRFPVKGPPFRHHGRGVLDHVPHPPILNPAVFPPWEGAGDCPRWVTLHD